MLGTSMPRSAPARAPRVLGMAILPLLLGIFFFSASLTPSLIPRDWVVQGVFAGLVTAIGYMLGQFLLSLWRAIELPRLSGRAARIAHAVVAVPVLSMWLLAVVRAAHWQDTVRTRVGMEPAGEIYTLRVLTLAAVLFGICFVLGWLVQLAFDVLRRRLYRVMPERTAHRLHAVRLRPDRVLRSRIAVARPGVDARADRSRRVARDRVPAGRDAVPAGDGHGAVEGGA
ncbi:hypothetical protein N177_2988 [Lutibaculum baratangense AMV1]|uniref:Alpha/beta-hydrolase N-terminal domain-containing protein n=1 Tax=Lutibaculum baratangense AMV1 TaxID=631454 RepID=V4TBI4_9HYPH|nr:hypothetical protein N177_2988 [Lutibaculum baratangense AMV1]